MDNVQEKIRKLLALATGNPNENEAQAALRLAHRLMEKHAISEAQVRGMPTGEIDSESIPMATRTWRLSLMSAACLAHGCYHYYRPGHCVVVVGKPEARRRSVSEYIELAAMIDRFASHFRGRGEGRGFINSYRLGIVTKIRQEIVEARREAREEAQAEGNSTMALMVVDTSRQQAEAWARSRVRLGNARRQRASNNGGFEAGLRDGAGLYSSASRGKVGAGRLRIGAGR